MFTLSSIPKPPLDRRAFCTNERKRLAVKGEIVDVASHILQRRYVMFPIIFDKS